MLALAIAMPRLQDLRSRPAFYSIGSYRRRRQWFPAAADDKSARHPAISERQQEKTLDS
jgi:hypothetical protein